MASDTANATVHVCPEGGELAGQVIALLLVGMVLGAAIFSVPIAILLTRRDEKRREASAKEKQQLKKQNTMAAFAAMPSEPSSDATPQRRNSESRRSRDDGREPRKYGTPEQIARRSISEAGAAGAWMTAPGDEESGEADDEGYGARHDGGGATLLDRPTPDREASSANLGAHPSA